MRAGVTPGPTRALTSPPGCLTHRGNAELRLSPTCTLFILWQVLYVNRSTLLTQIIRKLPPLLATLCSRICRLSRPCPGNDNHLMLYFVFTYTIVLNLSVFPVPRPSSPRGRRSPSRSMSRTCLSQRQPLKSRQPPLHLRPLPQLPRQLQKPLLARRPPARLHQQTIRTW